MFVRLHALLILLSLVACVAAWTPQSPNKPNKPTKVTEVTATEKQTRLRSRQNSRTRILARSVAKDVRSRINTQIMAVQKAIQENNATEVGGLLVARHGGKGGQTSSKPYPRCKNWSGSGYAHYDGWYWDGNSLDSVSTGSWSSCAEKCSSWSLSWKRGSSSSSCIGSVYSTGTCTLKGESISSGSVYQSSGSSCSLVGGCSQWSGNLPSGMDSDCCEL